MTSTSLDTAIRRALAAAGLASLAAVSHAQQAEAQRLEEIASQLRKEKEARSGRKDAGGPPATTGNAAVDAMAWAWAKEEFFRGVELKGEDHSLAEQVLMEFVADFKLAKDASEDLKKLYDEAREKQKARLNAPENYDLYLSEGLAWKSLGEYAPTPEGKKPITKKMNK